jgi:hypothetical protein
MLDLVADDAAHLMSDLALTMGNMPHEVGESYTRRLAVMVAHGHGAGHDIAEATGDRAAAIYTDLQS